MIKGVVEVGGLQDIQERVARLGLRAQDLRRPNAFIGAQLVVNNRRRLDAGVDVHGMPLRSKLSARLGLKPLGGASGLFGQSIKWEIEGHDLNLFSTFIGAGVAYRGDTIVPKVKKWLTIPARARGGEFATPARAVAVLGNRTGRRAAHYSKKTTFFLRRNGKLYLMQKEESGALRVLFFLVKKVRYPKNEWLGASESDLNMAIRKYSEHLDTFSDGGSR